LKFIYAWSVIIGGERKHVRVDGVMGAVKEPIDVFIERQQKEPEELAKERLDIIVKSVELKVPMRVPISGVGGDVVAHFCGITWYDWCYDLQKAKSIINFVKEYPQDFRSASAPYGLEGFIFSLAFADFPEISNSLRFLTGPLHDLFKDKWTKWPGRELDKDMHPQFIGGEFMKQDEYKQLIDDPVKFINEVILPRVCLGLGTPGSSKWNGTLIRVGQTIERNSGLLAPILQEISNLGYPPILMTPSYTPADFIGDFLRYPTGAMLDMRSKPEDFKAACEALVEPILKVAEAVPPAPPLTFSFIPCHLNEMLSPKLYREFYWPTQKRVILELVKKGYKMFIFYEGDHTPHIDTLLELPKGWGVAYFEKARNFVKDVWEKLKGHTCVMGGLPTNLLIGGTPEKIDEYVKNLLRQTRSEGGFIISPGVSELPKETPLQNIRAYINAALKYGR
jgi:hypothetical protein